MPSLFIGYYKALQENGSKSGLIKEFEATPTQSLATSGRFARKSIRPDLSHFALWHTTLCWRLAYLSEIMFKLRLDSKYVITAYLSLFLFQAQRTTKTHRANRLKSGRTNVRWNDLIPKWPLTTLDELNTAPISSLSLTAVNLHLWNPANTSLITNTREAARSRKLTAWVSASLAMPIPCINRRSRFNVAMVTG